MAFKVLAVDDDAVTLKLIKETASLVGLEVLVFNSGLEAERQTRQQKFDGAFVSNSASGMDGFELVKGMRESPSNKLAPIVMLTSVGDVATMRKAFQVGVTFFLSKPCDPKRLRGLLNAMRGQMLLEKRRYARLPLRTIVQCRVGNNTFKTLSVDLSQSGMLLEAAGPLNVGAEADLQFDLPDNAGHLNIHGKVVRTDANNRPAVQFGTLSPQDRKALSDFISGMVKG